MRTHRQEFIYQLRITPTPLVIADQFHQQHRQALAPAWQVFVVDAEVETKLYEICKIEGVLHDFQEPSLGDDLQGSRDHMLVDRLTHPGWPGNHIGNFPGDGSQLFVGVTPPSRQTGAPFLGLTLIFLSHSILSQAQALAISG